MVMREGSPTYREHVPILKVGIFVHEKKRVHKKKMVNGWKLLQRCCNIMRSILTVREKLTTALGIYTLIEVKGPNYAINPNRYINEKAPPAFHSCVL